MPTSDAVMFTPQAVWARDFLKRRKDPPQVDHAGAPAHSFVSLRRPDGGEHRAMVRRPTEPAAAISPPSGSARDGSWRWVYDGGGPTRLAKRRRA